MRLLIDTHVLLWWLTEDKRLKPVQREAIDHALKEGERLGVSVICFWEIAKLVERGRLHLHRSIDQMFADLEAHSDLDVYPLSPRIALESTRLGPAFHADPADQILAATARVHGLRLVTSDDRIRSSGSVAVV